jgi:hypothetical protein
MTANDSRQHLIFAHRADARVAASVTLVGVLAVLLGGVSMAIGPRLNQESAVRGGAAGNAGPVRVIGTAPANTASCGDQVWPNIDQRCLVRIKASAPAQDQAAVQKAAKEAKEIKETKTEDGKLTPLTATGTVGRAVTPQDEAIAARQAAPVQPRREATNWQARSDERVQYMDEDDADDAEEAPPPPRHVHRHIRFPFHVHFGGFRF